MLQVKEIRKCFNELESIPKKNSLEKCKVRRNQIGFIANIKVVLEKLTKLLNVIINALDFVFLLLV